MKFIAIIPARYASSRLPNKPLADINGKPMVVHVMERARESGASRVIVAVDHIEVANVVQDAGGEICMTRIDHNSGTERLSEVIEHYGFSDDQIIVNVQGDEPMISPVIIFQVAENLIASRASMATLAVPMNQSAEAFNPNTVKVVIDAQGYALYFSRANIPFNHQGFAILKDKISYTLLRHIGIYSYRVAFIRRYVNWQVTQLEQIESLEQLRVLWYGEKIYVARAKVMPSIGVDTLADLQRVRNSLC